MTKSLAILIILTFTGIHFMGVRLGGGVQNVLTALKILLVLGLAGLGVILGSGDWSNISFRTTGPVEGLAVGTAMMLVMFAYSGWNASAYIAGELINPRRSLPVSLLAGTGIVVVLYLFINLFYFHAVPYSELQGVITVAEKASVHSFGEWMGNGFSMLTSMALLSSLSAFIIIGPRVYHAMACDGLFFRFAARIHPRFGVPGRSIAIQGALAVVMVLVGSFEQLLVYLGFALSIFPWLAVAGLFIARKRGIGEDMAFKVWGYPLTPLFFLAASLALMIVAFINRPVESSVALATVVLGIPCYFMWMGRTGRR